jgi:hypothetical protein
MARVNVYLPEGLAREWREAGFNLSRITQRALEQDLARWKADQWLARVTVQRGWVVSHKQILEALREAVATAGRDPL